MTLITDIDYEHIFLLAPVGMCVTQNRVIRACNETLTSINGVNQINKIKTTKALFTALTFIDQRNQLLFSYGNDLSVTNGLKEESRFNLRLLHVM